MRPLVAALGLLLGASLAGADGLPAPRFEAPPRPRFAPDPAVPDRPAPADDGCGEWHWGVAPNDPPTAAPGWWRYRVRHREASRQEWAGEPAITYQLPVAPAYYTASAVRMQPMQPSFSRGGYAGFNCAPGRG